MQKRIVVKNSVYSFCNYGLLIILSFVTRRALISSFSIEYAGYEAVFSDIFTLLSIADMGMDSIISYRLYEKIVDGRQGIAEVMFAAKKIYNNIAKGVLMLGGCLIIFFPFFFSDHKYDLRFIIIIYIIQLLNLVISYMTGYKRLLMIADQKEYICLQWDAIISTIVQITRILVLVLCKNYYYYILLCIVQTLGQNIGINIKCDKEYGNHVCQKEMVRKEMNDTKKDMGSFLFHRISAVIYAATDNVVITAILGLASAGLYSNYYLITKYTYTFVSKIMKPMQASIGNFIYGRENVEKKYDLLKKLNIVAYFIAIFMCMSLIQSTNLFIDVWLGESYQLNRNLVVLMSLNIYIAINQDFIYYFRNSFGQYDFDKYYMIFSAVANVILRIILGRYWGLEGVAFGTIIGHLFIWYGRVKFVYQNYFHKNLFRYWMVEALKIFVLVGQLYILDIITENILDNGIAGIIRRELYVIGVVGFIGLIWIIYYKRMCVKKKESF